FSARYTRMEDLANDAGEVFAGLPLGEKEAFWQQAKKLEE
ncbi:MAG: nucleoside triphosphate pyrophosphohydrolase, partial [Chloroflexi bacterium]|nr:nucleoside triphosphate pyrophosphohydrolase [Chloroflexota bacterium]